VAKKKITNLQQVGNENEMLEFVTLLAELSVLDPSEFKRFGARLRGAKKRSVNTNKDC
jgi:hypothetical protein